nr:hypothetical protein [Tanacetum cinerariifolium]
MDALALTPCYYAFLITAYVPEVYMQQFWDSVYKHDTFYRFKMDKRKRFKLNLEIFRDIFKICPSVQGQDFDALPTDKEIMSFLRELGHTGEINSLNDVVVDHMHQLWRTFAALINKSLGIEDGLDGTEREYQGQCLATGATPLKKERKFKKPASPKLTIVPISIEAPTRKSKRKEKVDVTRGKGIELLSQVALTVKPPPAVLDISNNNNGWIEEELEEDPKMEEEEKEEEEAKDENGDKATVGTITRAFYSVPPFSDVSNTEYSNLKRLGEMDRYLSGLITERRSEVREHYKLKQSVSTLEDQMRGLMLEDKEEKERLKKKLRASQQEKEQIEQAFRHVIEWIRKQFGVEIPPCRRGEGNNANETRGQDRAPPVCECTFSGFMKRNPTPFHGKEGDIELCRWFEKSEMVFSISDCAERNKVKFVAATLQGRALTWWNSQVATLGLNVAIGKSWGDIKKMMLEEFCPNEEIQRMEDELRCLKLRDMNITAYTQRFHELVLLCPEAVLTEKKKVEEYIKGHRAKDCKKRSTPVCYECGEKGDTRNHCLKKNNPQGEQARGRAYVIKETDKDQGPNVVMGTFLLNNRYATVLFDSGSDKSFVNTSFSHLIDINPVRLNTSYEVELADGRVASTNIILKGCTINLVGHLFKIDLMPIELGTFDIIIGMDWLVEQDAVIIKFIERGSQLFVAHVTEKEPQEKRIEDVSLIRDFPEVFPDDFLGLPPPRQVEFRIDLAPGAAPVARATYRLAPSEMKELAIQLQELSKKGFIRPSSSPWGAP